MSLQAFVIGMIATPDAKLRAADVARLADKYEISPDVAAFFLRCWLGRG